MIKAIITITRPINVLITMAAVYVGGLISSPIYYSDNLLAAAFSAGLIAAFGNVINDIYDRKLDAKAKPFRPLASGALSLKFAFIQALVLASVGLAIASQINNTCLLLASIVALSLLVYTPVFKGRGYLGNILISAIGAMAFFYGAVSADNISRGIIPAAFAFLFHLIREIVKDMEDCSEDGEFNIQTGAVKYGLRLSAVIAIILDIVLIIATIVPYILGIYGFWYLAIVIVGIDISLLFIIIKLVASFEQNTYRLISGLMKAIMPLGILAIFLGNRGL